MNTKDNFSYSARWESVGLTCSYCVHQKNGTEWPNKLRNFSCGLHKLSLSFQLRENGYLNGEWFCKDFADDGKSYPPGLQEFKELKTGLKEKTIYSPVHKEFLKEISFSDL